MRILYFSRAYTTHDHRFLRKIADNGHEVFFLCLEHDSLFSSEKPPLPEGVQFVSWNRWPCISSKPDAVLQSIPDFESMLDDIRPDLIHAGPVQSCGFMTAMSGFHPFLLMSWGSDILLDSDQDDMWRWVTRYTLQHSDMFFCDCDAVRQRAHQLVAYPQDQIIQFPWGIDLNKFTPGPGKLSVREHSGWEDAFIILSTRSWEPVYGIETVLRSFYSAYKKDPRFRLLLLGDGSLSSKLQLFIVEHGLYDVIIHPGIVPHESLPDYYRTADLYLSCSHSDGTSISLIEAMGSGLPVVVTDLPGNREWVKHGENGWLAPPDDSDRFADYLLQSAHLTEEARQKIGMTNRRIAEARANWDQNIQILFNAYQKLKSRYAQ
jgi:glycosyltransferase involved in cell wall biosynthesis